MEKETERQAEVIEKRHQTHPASPQREPIPEPTTTPPPDSKGSD